jgi:hypothetical protein
MKDSKTPLVFSIENEPYRGRNLLFHFDEILTSCFEFSGKLAPESHKSDLTEPQKAAAILIPQSISLIASCRKLIRQGYLFGAKALIRPMIERIVILLYLQIKPEDITHWQNGWKFREAPSLTKMLEIIAEDQKYDQREDIKNIMQSHNSIIHGKPESSIFSVTNLPDGKKGLTPAKSINDPALCDEICAEVIPWVGTLLSMMALYFPKTP